MDEKAGFAAASASVSVGLVLVGQQTGRWLFFFFFFFFRLVFGYPREKNPHIFLTFSKRPQVGLLRLWKALCARQVPFVAWLHEENHPKNPGFIHFQGTHPKPISKPHPKEEFGNKFLEKETKETKNRLLPKKIKKPLGEVLSCHMEKKNPSNKILSFQLELNEAPTYTKVVHCPLDLFFLLAAFERLSCKSWGELEWPLSLDISKPSRDLLKKKLQK